MERNVLQIRNMGPGGAYSTSLSTSSATISRLRWLFSTFSSSGISGASLVRTGARWRLAMGARAIHGKVNSRGSGVKPNSSMGKTQQLAQACRAELLCLWLCLWLSVQEA